MDRIISVTTPRIDVADVLRGFAVAGIIILHSLEHFGFYSFPEQPAWNQQVWDATFFLLSNKMYAIFAMLFGLSFFIQFDNQDRRRMANPALGRALHGAWRCFSAGGCSIWFSSTATS